MNERVWARAARRSTGANQPAFSEARPTGRAAGADDDSRADRVGALIRMVSAATIPSVGSRPASSEVAPVQRVVKAKKTGEDATEDRASFVEVSKYFGVDRYALLSAVAAKFFATDLFPDTYVASHATNAELKGELFNMANTLIEDSASATVVQAAAGNVQEVATALWTVIAPAVDAPFLNRFPNFKAMQGLGTEDATSFAGFLNLAAARLRVYMGQIDENKYDPASLKQNAVAKAKIKELRGRVLRLRKDLGTAHENGSDTGGLMTEVKQLVAEIGRFEKAWELDARAVVEKVDAEVATLGANTTAATSAGVDNIGSHYVEDGGTDDGMEVTDAWSSVLGCTLYSILALKGSWLGTDSPEELHHILRKSKKLAVYDENAIAAKVRLLAGMKATAVGGGLKVKDYIARETAAAKDKTPESVIMDTAGVAHTFAAVWDGAKFVRADETTSSGGFGTYDNNEILWIWK